MASFLLVNVYSQYCLPPGSQQYAKLLASENLVNLYYFLNAQMKSFWWQEKNKIVEVGNKQCKSDEESYSISSNSSWIGTIMLFFNSCSFKKYLLHVLSVIDACDMTSNCNWDYTVCRKMNRLFHLGNCITLEFPGLYAKSWKETDLHSCLHCLCKSPSLNGPQRGGPFLKYTF